MVSGRIFEHLSPLGFTRLSAWGGPVTQRKLFLSGRVLSTRPPVCISRFPPILKRYVATGQARRAMRHLLRTGMVVAASMLLVSGSQMWAQADQPAGQQTQLGQAQGAGRGGGFAGGQMGQTELS